MAILISFDIDGTLETGDPPGPITMDMVRKALELGFVVGSCSDRSTTAQQAMWDKHNIEPHFVSPKHMLDALKERFPADKYVHIGDRELDRQFAERADFDFMWMDDAQSEPWLAWDSS